MFAEEHVSELIPAYALDILDEGELARAGEHLAHCPACQTELREYRKVAELVPLGVPLAEPAPEVKARLMTQVQSQAVRNARPGLTQRLADLLRVNTPAWGLTSLALILMLLTSNVLLWQQTARQAAVPPPALDVINLSDTGSAPGAIGVIIVSKDGEHGTLVVDRLPVLPEHQEYQLWLIHDGQRDNGGVFSVGDDGYRSMWVDSPQPLAGYTGFGVTIEPAGGSPGPTGERVLAGEL